jgi:hypothetical protein
LVQELELHGHLICIDLVYTKYCKKHIYTEEIYWSLKKNTSKYGIGQCTSLVDALPPVGVASRASFKMKTLMIPKL